MRHRFYHSVSRLRLPAHHRDQLLRAASSVALNLAEGNAKTSVKDRRRFFEIALGSLRECQMVLRLERIADPQLFDLADHHAAILWKLTRSKGQ